VACKSHESLNAAELLRSNHISLWIEAVSSHTCTSVQHNYDDGLLPWFNMMLVYGRPLLHRDSLWTF